MITVCWAGRLPRGNVVSQSRPVRGGEAETRISVYPYLRWELGCFTVSTHNREATQLQLPRGLELFKKLKESIWASFTDFQLVKIASVGPGGPVVWGALTAYLC